VLPPFPCSLRRREADALPHAVTHADQPQLLTLAEGVYAWIGAGGDSNAGAVATPEGLLVIDTQQYPRLAQQFRDALRAKTGQPLRTIINTHCHLDHTSGNVVFADVPILAHEKTLSALERGLGQKAGDRWTIMDYPTKVRMLFGQNIFELVPENDPAQSWFRARISLPDYDTVVIAPPTETFTDQFSFHLPHDTVRLSYFGPAHCDGDVVVHLEQSKVVFLGDLQFYGRFPWLGDCDLNGWINTLERVLALDVAMVVPGHGMPTTLLEVACFRDMLIALRDAVDRAIKAGLSEDAAVREVSLPQYSDIPRYQDWMPINIKSAYRYLRGERA
jgi:glyoxylase-like metal-dependent hydrolase (beta-lactamase superfamily II)